MSFEYIYLFSVFVISLIFETFLNNCIKIKVRGSFVGKFENRGGVLLRLKFLFYVLFLFSLKKHFLTKSNSL